MPSDYDIMQFSNLEPALKRCVKVLIEMADREDDIDELRSIAKSTFHILGCRVNNNILLSSTKDFRKLGTTLGDAEAGLHVFRTYFANRIHQSHRKKVGFKSGIGEQFDQNGYVKLENYIPNLNLVNRVREEIEPFPLAISKNNENIICNAPNTDALREFVFGRGFNLKGLRADVFDCLGLSLSHEEARNCYTYNTFVQKLHNKKDDGDIQKVFHQDTFFPCIKFWYFPEEVTLDNGPLVYVPNSHLLTEQRMRFIYEQSIAITKKEIDTERTYSHEEGSLRIYEDELAAMNLNPLHCTVPANTLIVANVFGFHRRGDVREEGFRNSIHGSIRINTPFE